LALLSRRFLRARLARACFCAVFRDHRQQQEWSARPSEVQAGDAREQLGWAVPGIVVQERPAALELVLEIRQPPAARPAVLVVLAANGQAETVTGRQNDAGRPDFDVELDDRAGAQRLPLAVGMIGPVRL